MKKILFIVLGLLTALGGASFGAEPSRLVGKGDTLWDISNEVWSDYLQWPVLWSLNPQFTNPHWISPGDPIYLKKSAPVQDRRVVRLPLERLSPKMDGDLLAEDGADSGVAGPSPSGGGDVAGGRSVLLSSFSARAGGAGKIKLAREQGLDFISSHKISRLATVSNVKKKKTVYVAGEQIELKIDPEVSLARGDFYTIFDDSGVVRHPSFEEPIGYMVKILGHVEIVSTSNDRVVGRLVETYDVVEDGAGLMAFSGPVKEIQLRTARVELSGKIIGGRRGQTIFSSNDIVFLDKGSIYGLDAGVVLEVPIRGDKGKADGTVTDLNAPLARLVVLSVQDKTASGIILENRGVVEIGDMFSTPGNLSL